MAAITIRTNGQTLRVNASVSHWTSAALAAVGSGDDDIPSTDTTTITSDYTLHFANTATVATVTVTQPDGTTLVSKEFQVSPAYGPRTLNPVPDQWQAAAGDRPGDVVWRSGSYYYVSNGVVQSSGAITVDTLLLVPCLVPNAVTLTKIGGYVTGAGGSGSVIRFGIYSSDGLGGIGSLLLDAGTIDGTSATVQEITISQAVPKGLHWFGVVAQVGTQPSMDRDTTSANNIPFPYRTTVPTTTFKPVCVTQASVSGALPATLSAPAASGSFPPRVFVKA